MVRCVGDVAHEERSAAAAVEDALRGRPVLAEVAPAVVAAVLLEARAVDRQLWDVRVRREHRVPWWASEASVELGWINFIKGLGIGVTLL